MANTVIGLTYTMIIFLALRIIFPLLLGRQSVVGIKHHSTTAWQPLIRHFPDNPQIQGNSAAVPPPRELHPFRSHPMARFWTSKAPTNVRFWL